MTQRKLSDWIQGYAEFTAESDSPQSFHLWCCLGTIAGAAQRKIFMQTTYFPVHSNLYVILVSPPGRGKKTAALRTSKNIIREIQPEVNFATESGSYEGLVDLFLGISNPAHQSLSLYSMELGSILGTNPANMIDFLTDIYDGNPDWARSTVAHGKKVIKKPWLNIMAGTTPKWLGEHLGLIALEGGLIARCILTYSEELLLENSWPEETPHLRKLRSYLVEDLSAVTNISGEFKFEGGRKGPAFFWYDTWYRNKPEDWQPMAERLQHPLVPLSFASRYPAVSDPRTASYYDRKHVHLLKVAMLLSLSYKDELILTLEDLLRAKALLDATEPGLRLALNAVGKNDSTVELFHILQQIRSKGSVGYGELLIENYHNLRAGKRSLDQMLEELRMMGKIKQEGNKFVYQGV